MDPNDSYGARLRRLASRWDPRGVLVSDAKAYAALELVRATPIDEAQQPKVVEAQRVCNAVVHPVLGQPVPSAFRLCSFMPVTGALSLAMIASPSPIGQVFCHWFYQTHSALCRYCNYADTSRPLNAELMLRAYGLSTLIACGIGAGTLGLVHRIPRLRSLGLFLPHTAVGCAGAVSTVVNALPDMQDGVQVTDGDGNLVGVSCVVARASVTQVGCSPTSIRLPSHLRPIASHPAFVLSHPIPPHPTPRSSHRIPSRIRPSPIHAGRHVSLNSAAWMRTARPAPGDEALCRASASPLQPRRTHASGRRCSTRYSSRSQHPPRLSCVYIRSGE